ncbi:MAG TPA: LysM domain-containing protein [Bryobacteraceae bacterium]|nr:LysM domain-containing protein [Bryobacteraceae bacterium]
MNAIAPKREPKPVEREPRGTKLPRGYFAALNGGFTYRVKDGDTWESVAQKFVVGVKELIFFNFMTDEPDEVNWYLRRHTGCNKASPSGNNWIFSSSARPGIIYIPPAEHDAVDGDDHEICVWIPNDVRKFLLRLNTIAQAMQGNKGARVKRLAQVILRAGYPACRGLWYYNDLAVMQYVSMHTGNAQRRDMTKTTRGAYPFDGDSGTHGPWKIFAISDLLDQFACDASDSAALKAKLEWIDAEMYKGWYQLSLIDAQTSQGGGNAYGELVGPFINHVRLLSKDKSHLYWAFG